MILSNKFYLSKKVFQALAEIFFRSLAPSAFRAQSSLQNMSLLLSPRLVSSQGKKEDSDHFSEKFCTACGACAEQCPSQSIHLEKRDETIKTLSINLFTCTNCSLCVDICPERVLEMKPLDISLYISNIPDIPNISKREKIGRREYREKLRSKELNSVNKKYIDFLIRNS